MEDFRPDLLRFLHYMQFKQECMQYQFENPIRLDMDLAVKSRDTLLKQQAEKVEQLKQVMPKVPVVKKKTKPKVTHKKDGTLSANGAKWFKLLREHRKPPTYKGVIEVVDGYNEPNPNSPDQVKAWLFSLGWEPCYHKYVREGDGSERTIPQVRKDGELTPSVLRLKDKAPEVEILEGLTVIQHRLGIFQGFIDCALECDGKYYLRAEIGGLTNTLRFKHKKPLVNLPGVDKPWGKEIRCCLIAPDGYEVVGSDMVSLESTTKRHYIYPIDPEYAEEMSQEGFDEHLDLACHAGALTQEQVEAHKEGREDYSKTRKKFKPVNYSAVYGVGATKLSRETGMSVKDAKALLDAYWKRNKAVKIVAQQQKVKESHGYFWLLNPVSGFWHELRFDKDRFSTLNQSTGVYLFDSWLARARLNDYLGVMQFHDETAGLSPVGKREETEKKLETAIDKLNEDLNLNVTLAIDTQFGQSYGDVH